MAISVSYFLRRTFGRLGALPRDVSFPTACRLIASDYRSGLVGFFLRTTGREVFIRAQTTDLTCFEKIFRYKEYELPFPLEPRVIVDAGANIGMATLRFAALYPNARIIAIEPESSNFAILQKNCAGLPNVSLVNAALWPEHGALSFQDAGAENWAFAVKAGSSIQIGGVSIPAVTIPDLMQRFAIEKIDLLKLDIEGAELELFSTGSDQWLPRVGALVIELHDRMKAGCAQAFYRAVARQDFRQEVKGENIFIQFLKS